MLRGEQRVNLNATPSAEGKIGIQIGEFGQNVPEPNPLVAPIHPKAMITILAPEDIDTWLRGSYDEIVALQKPYDPGKMTVRGPMFPTRRDER